MVVVIQGIQPNQAHIAPPDRTEEGLSILLLAAVGGGIDQRAHGLRGAPVSRVVADIELEIQQASVLVACTRQKTESVDGKSIPQVNPNLMRIG